MSEKCNREMTRGINARDEPTCHAVVAVARSLAIQTELGKAATTWNQLLLLLLWYLIPKVAKPPPNIHHAGVEAVDGPRFNQKQRRARSGVSLFSSKSRLRTFLGGRQVYDKRKQYNLYNPASHLRNIMFRKV